MAYQNFNMEHQWRPFTPNHSFKKNSRVFVAASGMHSGFKGLPNGINIRRLGLAGAVELSPIAGAPGKRAHDIFMDCFHHGVLIRPAAENILIWPPYILEKEHIERIVNVVSDSIRKHG